MNLIIHPGTGTILDASECRLLTEADLVGVGSDEESLLDHMRHHPDAGRSIKDPAQAVWYDADAVREHFSGDDDLSDLSGDELGEVGEIAMFADPTWRTFAHTLSDALAYVREASA